MRSHTCCLWEDLTEMKQLLLNVFPSLQLKKEVSTVQLAGAVGVNARLGLVADIPYLKLSFTYFCLSSSLFSVESGNTCFVGSVCFSKNREIINEVFWFYINGTDVKHHCKGVVVQNVINVALLQLDLFK